MPRPAAALGRPLTRFNEAEALKPRMRSVGMPYPPWKSGFNEAEALKPRMLSADHRQASGVEELQ